MLEVMQNLHSMGYCVYGKIRRDGLTSEIYFLKFKWSFHMFFHVSSKVSYTKLNDNL